MLSTLTIGQHTPINHEQNETRLSLRSETPEMASSFRLEAKSFAPPTKRQPLRISFTTQSCGRGAENSIHPVAYLQLSYDFGDCGVEIFSPEVITPRDVEVRRSDGHDKPDEYVYSIAVAREDMPMARVPAGHSGAAQVTLHAWSQKKLLDSQVVGVVEGLGLPI